VDRSGNFAYVANFGSNDLSAYTITSTGALTAVTGSPFPGDESFVGGSGPFGQIRLRGESGFQQRLCEQRLGIRHQ